MGARVDDCTDLASHRAGDPAAFARLYDRHAAIVFSICRLETPGRNEVDAEDAAQETFFRAYRLLDRIVDCRGFPAWLHAIARLVCSERRRSTARRRRHEDSLMSGPATLAASAVDSEAAHRERLAMLGAAMEELDDDEQLALHLYYLDRDPVAAAHRELGLSRSAFYKVLARSRERLAARLGRETTP